MSRFFALMSLVLFAGSLLTAIHSRFLARMFGGLASQFRWHHGLGLVTGLALVTHVMWELVQTPPPLVAAIIFTTDPPLLAGWVALLLFVLALVLGYQESLRFRTWRRWHLLFPLAFIAAAYHALAFGQDAVLDQWVLRGSLGLGSLCLLVLASGVIWNPGTLRYRVHSLKRISDTAWELLLEPKGTVGPRAPFRAGEVVYLRFLGESFTRSMHPFSVASCRLEPLLRLDIKSLGRDTSHLQDLTPQTEVDVLGPFAQLRLELDREQIWIGGGIGIAPFLGFLHCTENLETPPIHVFHFVSRPEDKIQQDEIQHFQATTPSLAWHDIVDREGRGPNLDDLDSLLKTVRQPRIVICGPNPFMRMVRRHLQSQCISPRDIVTEEFIP